MKLETLGLKQLTTMKLKIVEILHQSSNIWNHREYENGNIETQTANSWPVAILQDSCSRNSRRRVPVVAQRSVRHVLCRAWWIAWTKDLTIACMAVFLCTRRGVWPGVCMFGGGGWVEKIMKTKQDFGRIRSVLWTYRLWAGCSDRLSLAFLH